MKGCAPGLALKKRHKTTRKWPTLSGSTRMTRFNATGDFCARSLACSFPSTIPERLLGLLFPLRNSPAEATRGCA